MLAPSVKIQPTQRMVGMGAHVLRLYGYPDHDVERLAWMLFRTMMHVHDPADLPAARPAFAGEKPSRSHDAPPVQKRPRERSYVEHKPRRSGWSWSAEAKERRSELMRARWARKREEART